MKLHYKEPEMQIRRYEFPSDNLYTTSPGVIDPPTDPDLGDGNDWGDIFG